MSAGVDGDDFERPDPNVSRLLPRDVPADGQVPVHRRVHLKRERRRDGAAVFRMRHL